MDVIFSELSEQENDQLVGAIPLITLLIGSADGLLEQQETEWAERVIKFRTFSHDEELHNYYQAVFDTFDHRLDVLMRATTESLEFRKKYLSDKLASLNPILQKLDRLDALKLYHDFLSFAKHVAKSSGGILYMANISPAEKALMSLDMISPIDRSSGI